jgi:hypothetical protein
VFVTLLRESSGLSPRVRVHGEYGQLFLPELQRPDHAPKGGGKEALKEEYRTQLSTAEVVIVLSSLYVEDEYWTTYQMDAAQASNRPLIALGFFGSAAKVPAEIAKRAAEIVDWNERQIADAVRRQARGEATNRWETIEFKL